MPAGWVSAAAAAGGAIEGIQANKAAAGAVKANNASAGQLQGAQGSMLSQAQQVAQQPFQQYTGTLTAPMSGNEQQGYSLASSTANNGVAQGLNSKANSLIDQVGGSNWNSDTASKYMNPYTEAVTNSAIANSNKAYLQNLAGLQSTEGGSGAFGGSRSAIGQAELAGQQNLNIGNLTATGNANAYDTAMKAWQADNATKLSAAQAYNQSGQDVTQMNSNQISDLMKTGGVSQIIAQTNLDNQYGQFMRQQNWSANQLQPLISAVSSARGGNGVGQTAPIQSNVANQLLGLGSTIAGLFGGGSSGTPTVGNSLGGAPDLVNNSFTPPPVGIDGSTVSGLTSTLG